MLFVYIYYIIIFIIYLELDVISINLTILSLTYHYLRAMRDRWGSEMPP